jgi:hypothetical protein
MATVPLQSGGLFVVLIKKIVKKQRFFVTIFMKTAKKQPTEVEK